MFHFNEAILSGSYRPDAIHVHDLGHLFCSLDFTVWQNVSVSAD